ncbi:hypothetical protein M409DRAFT_28889 [Zasmidium cellare ATCC 36951]|uniref:Membrane insertase YidC/Oxa/ALB C-terminal domain-containing protein n=1 Tax=Zasmidium cellare ATCC 36951 TaxID=1080233 RepID=A0A6A6C1L1_ZASCE|nr:uncharacterized protein M409DRAFT_28889 [Zasmidium cellare ATCC 36951]KAF2160753.1 hypothetical protein M409DRAFT_28889 [Zasmidium cellare ATCC 36951]
MMPSRGLHTVARAKVPRLIQSQCRNFSSAPRPHLQSVSHNTSSLTRTSQPWTRSIPATIPSIAALRYASTAQSQPAAGSPPAPVTPTPSEASSFPNLDTITLDDINIDKPEAVPETIGYLHSLGLDYGWGPTSCLEWFLEHFHVWGGLPWWGAIAATAMTMRLVMFPLYLKSSDAMARQTAIASVTQPINDRLEKCRKTGDREGMMLAFQQLQAIRQRAGIKMSSQFMPMIAQGVLGYCGFKLMRACATLPVPGFTEGGFLWLQDLTLSDGFLVMPALMALTMHLVVRLGGETGAQTSTAMSQGMKKGLMYGMPVLIFGFTCFQPGAVAVWFAASGVIGITQGQLLQRKPVREFFGLAPLYRPKPGESSGGIFDAFMKNNAPQPHGPSSESGPGGKNSVYMAPTYQSPNLNVHKSSSNVIDTTLATPKTEGPSTSTSSDMIQPNTPAKPKQGIIDSISSAASNTFKQAKQMTDLRAGEQSAEQKKVAWKRKADAYERNAQKRGR